MGLEGLDAVRYLNGPNTVRDGILTDLSVHYVAGDPVVELTFEVQRKSRVTLVMLELRAVQEFDYGFTRDNPPRQIPLVKCLMTEAGDFYLALDPYDEREDFPSERDNESFAPRFSS
jgi:hypothetical protein